ncbi:MAG TPA: LLM class flavin-dependent oxidoreductase [Candidatus Angelobacter sp.]|nr:LLM class flavin-dependent oxidoreductase [Candidatus Angelobacter sp.]
MTDGIKLGALAWNQYTEWPALREAGIRADALGYDSLWTWDHLYPIVGSDDGPILEGWLTLAAWAEATERAKIGLMVGANPFRNPALVAKMATTLDHISGGRAILGIGAAWFETEHRAYGLEFGDSPGERLRWLEEAVKIMRGMLHGEEPSGERYYAAQNVRNDPPPVQARLPLLIGGGGERKTLRIVARYADACNVGGGFDNVKRKDEILRRHCADVGRDESEIERTVGMGTCVIRDDPAEAQRVLNQIFERNGHAEPWTNQLVGTPEQVAEKMRPYLGIGFRHYIIGFPSPHDAESMERLVREVRPMLESA